MIEKKQNHGQNQYLNWQASFLFSLKLKICPKSYVLDEARCCAKAKCY